MKHYFIKILRHGDSVMHVTPDQIIVRRANGEVDIFRIFVDDAGAPRIDHDNVMTITYGEGTIEVESGTASKVKQRDRSIEIESGPGSKAKKKKSRGQADDKDEDAEVITGTF